MNDHDELGSLGGVFALLSLMAIGGINATLPEMHRFAVDVHQWTTDSEFTSLYGLSQAAPGPNLMVSTLIGWHVAGFAGAAVATIAVILPSAALCYVVTRTWARFREARWRKAVQAGMIPVALGMIAAGAYVITLTVADGSWRPVAVTAITAAIVLLTRIHPFIPLAAAGALGYAGAF
jgi:chromate transporter